MLYCKLLCSILTNWCSTCSKLKQRKGKKFCKPAANFLVCSNLCTFGRIDLLVIPEKNMNIFLQIPMFNFDQCSTNLNNERKSRVDNHTQQTLSADRKKTTKEKKQVNSPESLIFQ